MKAKHRTEGKALDELQSRHGYMFTELTHAAERQTMQYVRDPKTGTAKCVPAVCVRLIVPADSKLGQGIVTMRSKANGAAKKGKRK